MNLDQARRIIHDPDAFTMEKLMATVFLAESPDSTLDDLVDSLRLRGVIGEAAAWGLYQRTGRERPKKLRDYSNVEQWEQFLIKRRLLGEAQADRQLDA